VIEDKRICYVFASRERPKKFFDCLNTIFEFSASANYFVWAKLDIDDPFILEYVEGLKNFKEVTTVLGISEGKIHAINRHNEGIPYFDIICCQSDDMKFLKWGFDDTIREHCGDDDYVHFPDGYADARLCTYTIMGKDYYKRDGYIYNPKFISVYADNLQFDLARQRGRHKFVNEKILRHEHPIAGYGIMDDLMKRTEDSVVYKKDHQTYITLKKEYEL